MDEKPPADDDAGVPIVLYVLLPAGVEPRIALTRAAIESHQPLVAPYM